MVSPAIPKRALVLLTKLSGFSAFSRIRVEIDVIPAFPKLSAVDPTFLRTPPAHPPIALAGLTISCCNKPSCLVPSSFLIPNRDSFTALPPEITSPAPLLKSLITPEKSFLLKALMPLHAIERKALIGLRITLNAVLIPNKTLPTIPPLDEALTSVSSAD